MITVKDDSGKIVAGATIRLYKDAADSGITHISDSTGITIFSELEPELYYWHAQKGCKTNQISQTTLNRPLIPKAILYGYSVLSETGTLKIINSATEPYRVSDSLFKVTIHKDTPYIAHRRARSYLIHSEKLSAPGTGRDTSVNIKCGDTLILTLPF